MFCNPESSPVACSGSDWAELVWSESGLPESDSRLARRSASFRALAALKEQLGLGVKPAQAMPGQIHNVCSQLLLAHLWPVGPVLPGEYGHAHQHLRVVRHALGRQLLPFECFGKNVFNAYGDVSHQRAE